MYVAEFLWYSAVVGYPTPLPSHRKGATPIAKQDLRINEFDVGVDELFSGAWIAVEWNDRRPHRLPVEKRGAAQSHLPRAAEHRGLGTRWGECMAHEYQHPARFHRRSAR
ncbi:hypothetical protein [Ralstonia phage phiRSL1]|uniref:Uncharacterized protein n=1 Tax=Ralstonia phage phiRSL1 TaxID=1980924 RepID=C4T8W8_9CAUD|nr:hypothetical protein RSL1_ORF087 [Ralstonia phage phiRSL1]BAH72942.1 hypothetical protein [Ralstonia phage phiRSL1]